MSVFLFDSAAVRAFATMAVTALAVVKADTCDPTTDGCDDPVTDTPTIEPTDTPSSNAPEPSSSEPTPTDTPAPETDTPAPETDTPAPVTDTPAPVTGTPVPVTASPPVTTSAPAATTSAPAVTKAASSTPASSSATKTNPVSTSTPTSSSVAIASTPSGTASTSPSTSSATPSASISTSSTAPNTSNSSSMSASSSGSGVSQIHKEASSGSSYVSAPASISSGSSSSSATVAGSAAAVVVILAIIALVWRRFHRKKHMKSSEDCSEDTPPTYQSVSTPNNVTRQHGSLLGPGSPKDSSSPSIDQAIQVARIPRDRVVVEALVSQGGFGEVYRGTYKGDRVAIKMLQPAIRSDMKQIHSFLGEAKIMASIDHPRLVTFIGVAWDSLRDLCVVLEFMDGGDLRSLIKQWDETQSKHQGFDADKTKIAMHVAHALTYLHSLAPIVIHRDLKSRNILLDAEWNAKLTDFGVSRESSDRTMTAGVGTTLWMAPEVMMGERYDEKADIFSFGVVLTELDSQQMPYASTKSTDSGRTMPDTAILQKVALGSLQAQFSPNAPQWLRELGAACLSLNPADRPTAAEIQYVLQTESKNR